MSQGLKYLKEENMEEIIANYTYHTKLNTLNDIKYSEGMHTYPKTHKAGMETVRSWLRWTCNEIMTEEFFESLVKLEDAMQKEKLVETNVHEVLEAVMLVQEITEEPAIQIQKISHDMEITHEMKKEEFKELENYYEKKNEEAEELCRKNNVTLE
jgi:hypothetical protein